MSTHYFPVSAVGTISRAPGNCRLSLHDTWLTGATGLTANWALIAKLWAGHAPSSLQSLSCASGLATEARVTSHRAGSLPVAGVSWLPG